MFWKYNSGLFTVSFFVKLRIAYGWHMDRQFRYTCLVQHFTTLPLSRIQMAIPCFVYIIRLLNLIISKTYWVFNLLLYCEIESLTLGGLINCIAKSSIIFFSNKVTTWLCEFILILGRSFTYEVRVFSEFFIPSFIFQTFLTILTLHHICKFLGLFSMEKIPYCEHFVRPSVPKIEMKK